MATAIDFFKELDLKSIYYIIQQRGAILEWYIV